MTQTTNRNQNAYQSQNLDPFLQIVYHMQMPVYTDYWEIDPYSICIFNKLQLKAC